MEKHYPKKLKGIIVSARMNKTAIVRVTRLAKAPKYSKYYKVSKRFKAHNENDEHKEGDVVIIQETRPLSKEKRWRIIGEA